MQSRKHYQRIGGWNLLNYSEYYNYNTIEGDTWDAISLDFYDTEYKSHILMEANPRHIKTLVFDAGVKLIIPVIDDEPADTLPPWKRE